MGQREQCEKRQEGESEQAVLGKDEKGVWREKV